MDIHVKYQEHYLETRPFNLQSPYRAMKNIFQHVPQGGTRIDVRELSAEFACQVFTTFPLLISGDFNRSFLS